MGLFYNILNGTHDLVGWLANYICRTQKKDLFNKIARAKALLTRNVRLVDVLLVALAGPPTAPMATSFTSY